VDYTQLLQPIAGDSAAGCYLKNDRSVYRGLRNTFNAAQSSFRQLIETPDSSSDNILFEENQKNWQSVNEMCWQTLTEQSKDIEIYCWWLMSLAFEQNAIEKIASGLDNLPKFIDSFWPNIQPYLPDEKLKSSEPAEQASQRAELQLRPLIQILGESANSGLLFMPLQMLALIGDIDHAQYFSATKSGNLEQLKKQAKQDFPNFKAEIDLTINALDIAIKSVAQLDEWLKKTATELSLPAISTHYLATNLTDCLQAIKYLVADCYAIWPLDSAETSPQKSNPSNTENAEKNSDKTGLNTASNTLQSQTQNNDIFIPPQVTLSSANMANRDQAFQELRKIADYFAKAEPHSPISFLLEKAIRWGYMSLPDLMKELVSDNDKVLSQINLITGINGEKTNITAFAPDPTSIQSPTNSSTESKISAIKDTVSKVDAPMEPEKISSEKKQLDETKKTPSDSDFNW